MWHFWALGILAVSWCSCLACTELEDDEDKLTEPLGELPEGELWSREDSTSMSEIRLEEWMLELRGDGIGWWFNDSFAMVCITGGLGVNKYVAYVPQWIGMCNWIGKYEWLEWAFQIWRLLVWCMVNTGTRIGKCSVGLGARVKSKSGCNMAWKNGLGEFGQVNWTIFLHETTINLPHFTHLVTMHL